MEEIWFLLLHLYSNSSISTDFPFPAASRMLWMTELVFPFSNPKFSLSIPIRPPFTRSPCGPGAAVAATAGGGGKARTGPRRSEHPQHHLQTPRETAAGAAGRCGAGTGTAPCRKPPLAPGRPGGDRPVAPR